MDSIITQNDVIEGQVVEPKELSEREKWISAVRALANFCEAHPDLPVSYSSIQLDLFPTFEEMRKYVSIFGKAQKGVLGDTWFMLSKKFYDDGNRKIIIEANWSRNTVCKKVVTGTKKVMKKVEVKPAETIEVEAEVETYEWECPKIAAPPAEFVEGD